MTYTACESEAIETNLRAFYAGVAREHRRSIVKPLRGVSLAAYAGPFQMFNGAFLDGLERHTLDELEARLLRTSRLFAGRQMEWCLWLRENLLAEHLRRGAGELFQAYCLQRVNRMPGMTASRVAAAARPLPKLHVREVRTPGEHQAFCRIVAKVFRIPLPWCQQLYGPKNLWTGSFRAWVACSGMTPIATSAWFWDGDSLGLYCVATLPRYRGCGVSESLLRTVMAQAQREYPIGRYVLQASRPAVSLYERLGFRTATHFEVYASIPAPPAEEPSTGYSRIAELAKIAAGRTRRVFALSV